MSNFYLSHRVRNRIKVCAWILLWVTSVSWATEHPSKGHTKAVPKRVIATSAAKPTPPPAPKLTGAGSTAMLSTAMQAELDAALDAANLQLEANATPADLMTDVKEVLSPETRSDRAQASQTFAYLDEAPDARYRENVSFEDLLTLPVGFRKRLSDNSTADIGIVSAKFDKDAAYVTVFVRIKTTLSGPNTTSGERELFFGVKDIKFTRTGGLAGSFTPILLGDVVLNFGNWTVILKGGLNMNTGNIAVEGATHAVIDCNQFQSARLVGEVVFPRSVIIPYIPNIGPSTGTDRVSLGINFVMHGGLENVVIDINSNKSFAAASYPKIGFTLQNLVLDLSDVVNSPAMVFPNEYQGDKGPTWRGVYIQQFAVHLPEEFDRASFGASNVLIDRQGFTGRVQATFDKTVDASGWAMTVNRFEAEFVANRFERGSFGGNIFLPVSDDPFAYNGLIDPGGEYALTVVNTGNLNFSFWKAKATLEPGSMVDLRVINGKFKPSATLNGSMSIVTDIGKSNDSDDATVNFRGVRFTQLRLQTEAPKVSFGSFEYASNTSSLGLFPVSITQLGLASGGSTDDLYLRLGVAVNLMDGGVAAATTVIVRAKEEGGKYRFKGLDVEALLIKGTVSVVGFEGTVCIYENETDKGFAGKLGMTITSPKTIKACVAAQFGRDKAENFKYWRVEGSLDGAFVPIAGPLGINGMGVAVYHHMRPSKRPTGSTSMPSGLSSDCAVSCMPGNIIYARDKTIGLGFKAVVSLGMEAPIPEGTFRGSAGFEMVFNSNYGLNSVGFFGEGELTASASSFAQGFLNEKLGDIVSTPAVSNLTQNKLMQKAVNEFTKGQISPNGRIAFQMALLYDFQNDVLHGEAELFMNIANVLRGVGRNDRAGWLVMHFEPNKWYIHAGTPNDRIGIRMALGPMSMTSSAYLMIGHGVPTALPKPPAQVIRLLGLSDSQFQRNGAETTQIAEGRGFAFGLDIKLETNIQVLILYAKLEAGMGFDILMAKSATSTPCGVNGFYAKGQFYAYIQADIGMNFNVFGRLQIFNAGAAVLLQGGMPNPAWFSGNIAGQYRLLGGKVKGSFKLDIDLGTKCI